MEITYILHAIKDVGFRKADIGICNWGSIGIELEGVGGQDCTSEYCRSIVEGSCGFLGHLLEAVYVDYVKASFGTFFSHLRTDDGKMADC